MSEQHQATPPEDSQSANNDAAFVSPESSENSTGNSELQQAIADRDRYMESWQRSQAELDNVRRRMLRELEQERQYRSLPLARDLLPVVDNLQRAMQAAEKAQDIGQLVQGMKMVLNQLEEAFSRHAIVPISTEGESFDPNLHEAILQQPAADKPPMTVLTEVERGYKLHDRVVRPSKVIVSAAAQ